MEKLRHLIYFLTYAVWNKSGLKFEKRDERNFCADEHLGWGTYEPKHKVKLIPIISTKNQDTTNTCVLQAGAGQKEVDEGVVCSARSIIIQAKKDGLISGNGYTSLSTAQKMIHKYGIMETTDCPDDPYNNWTALISGKIDLDRMAEHKSKSYYEVNSRASRFKAIDERHVIATAIKWYTGYNGRYLPENGILSPRNGYYVGGHSFKVIGYILGYKGINNDRLVLDSSGEDVVVLHNSYGESWGKSFESDGNRYNGIFFMKISDFDKECIYGNFVSLDIERDAGDFLKAYSGKNVRAHVGGGIYRISANKKRVYKSMFDFLSWNENRLGFIQLSSLETQVLNDLPDGEPMRAEESPLYKQHKDKLKELTNPQNLEALLTILYEKK